MNTDKISSALQDLIIRLQDAEKGYKEIYQSTSDVELKKWLNHFADERHLMKRAGAHNGVAWRRARS